MINLTSRLITDFLDMWRLEKHVFNFDFGFSILRRRPRFTIGGDDIPGPNESLVQGPFLSHGIDRAQLR